MTEKEKMLNNLMYDANYDLELYEDRAKVKDLCFEFNNLKPSEVEKQKQVLKKIWQNKRKLLCKS